MEKNNLTCVALIDAREKAIAKIVEQCGGTEDADNAIIRGVLVMLTREAAGQGFDAGVLFMSTPAPANKQATP
jgi:hypothetical protein